MHPVQRMHGTWSCRSPTGGDPRQAPLSSRALFSKPSSVPFKVKISHHSVPEYVISAVSNAFPLSPASTRPCAVPFLQIYKQAGRHDLKQQICTEAEKSSGSLYFTVPSEFFVLENRIKAKLSVILFYSGGISPLRSTIAC